ncbi:enoyl-CoA hydratase/isomerase family protein [Ramlibacter albus]|uniref:Enoyl-CoA hydratase/isomerase family protein n=1 Tax=Ramlibacter albus TaxID=2079448 RepID=A0A923MBA4_9BURK|nr:enoyl-CoA hydratase/isomerase family protein [Ramlibacter albus]MBC5767056.1 enoyl-CoA hydratase/isomerase family protein [Ramlibacter albus]
MGTQVERSERRAGGRVFAELCLVSENGLNPLSGETVAQLRAALREAAADDARHGVFVRAQGRAFSAGADVKEFRRFGVEDFRAAMQNILALYVEMVRHPKPIVALVQGDALGGGAALALCSDHVIAVHGAKFGFPEVHRGLAGGAYLMPRLIGKHLAAEMSLFGRNIDASRAYALGLIAEPCERDALEQRAQAVAEELAALAPSGLSVAKLGLALGLGDDLADCMAAHVEAQTRAFAAIQPNTPSSRSPEMRSGA